MQEDILAVIKQHPGILQCDLKKSIGLNSNTIYSQIGSLERNKKIVRKWYPRRATYELFLNTDVFNLNTEVGPCRD